MSEGEYTLLVYLIGVFTVTWVGSRIVEELSGVATYKVNVSLPPELVEQIDAIAAEQGLSRSGFIAEASSRYVAELAALSAEEERVRRIDKAIESMKERGKMLPRDFDYVAAIRKDRERDGWDGVTE